MSAEAADIVGGDDDDGITLSQILTALAARWRVLLASTFLLGAAGYAISFAITPTFVSSNTFMPPQQQGSGASAALAQLGALSGLAGATGVKSTADQYVSLMQSVTVSDNIIKRFDLMTVYQAKFMEDARKVLLRRAQINAGKKDGLIKVDVEDTDPKRAADMANRYVDELRLMTSRLAVTEAQQRRVFFEQRLAETKAALVTSQVALEGSGINAGALKAEPKSAAEGYAKLRADLTVAKVKLQVLRGTLAENASEVRQQAATVQALSDQVAILEAGQTNQRGSTDYVTKYREFKYQETLFDLFAKQYELARVDESREGALIQVVDQAMPAERKSAPRRIVFAGGAALMGLLAASGCVLVRRNGVLRTGIS